jgi:hypothetical protein
MPGILAVGWGKAEMLIVPRLTVGMVLTPRLYSD